MRSARELFDRIARIRENKGGYYEVRFPSGRVVPMTWNQLHVDFKRENRFLYEQLKYRWVENE